ncbi:SRPBCC domain-containing protein [Siminovitchia sp. FSL H7-0308]|uniref:Uncharacterized protein YndB with AHSA1/START domain n=1 Tax=Siminovitchia thermophila TaxID=1245522 RepID=A0ABS2R328_9BACI|nr:SRPBCC domain-containing protein [Siminovitchia thermophila]MBM7714048.1 uncharacterized protein YndB with AHSA1/START domain [Siminovitchia thermophila]ONK21644.1 ATPase [Bacillus sp. VT-16-64]
MTDHNTVNKVRAVAEGKILIIERSFQAPRELVFTAFSEQEHLEKWWGPKGWQTKSVSFEFKPGGIWHYCMTCTDPNMGEYYQQESWGKMLFHEMIVPEKIVYTDVFCDKDGNSVEDMPEMSASMVFTEQEGVTKVTIKTEFPSVEALQKAMEMGVVEGVSSQYERLDELLTKIG